MSAYGTIRCMYSCASCGLTKVAVEVPAREESQIVTDWVNKVAAVELARDHERRSPNCHPKTFTEVYIPISGARIIGGPAIQ